jgi:uncharacterized protein YeaO (DUF488 family)
MTTQSLTPDIRIARIYDPAGNDYGARIRLDRLWPCRLRKESVAPILRLKEFAPSPEWRRWFGCDPLRWAEFERCYRAELAGSNTTVKHGHVARLYAAHDLEHNHAFARGTYLRDH